MPRISELNSYVRLSVNTKKLTEDFLGQFQVSTVVYPIYLLLIDVKFIAPYKSVLRTLNGRGCINNYFLTRVSVAILVNFYRLLLYRTQIIMLLSYSCFTIMLGCSAYTVKS